MGRYISKFNTTSAFNAAESTLVRPHVSLTKDDRKVHFLSYIPPATIAVDLGLPSGKLWANMNLGASAPEEAGLYFSWGNVQGHTASEGYNWGTDNTGPYANTIGATVDDISNNSTYDAATVALGSPWRMPTKNDFNELLDSDNCTCDWTTVNGINGLLFTSESNGNTLFFPASGKGEGSSIIGTGLEGYYWSTHYRLDTPACAWYLGFNSLAEDVLYQSLYCGCSIRSIQDAPVFPIQGQFQVFHDESCTQYADGTEETVYVRCNVAVGPEDSYDFWNGNNPGASLIVYTPSEELPNDPYEISLWLDWFGSNGTNPIQAGSVIPCTCPHYEGPPSGEITVIFG